MKATGKFVYKSLEKRGSGEFKNDKGEVVKYGDDYILKVDEKHDGKIDQRKFKVDKNNLSLINQLKDIKEYTEIILECDVLIYENSCKLIPVSLVANSNNK